MKELILDNTMLSAWDTCPTKYYWRHIRNLVSLDDTSAALNFGTAIHKALETLYKQNNISDAIAELKPIIDAGPTDSKRNLENGIRIMLGYHERWFPERFKIVQVEIPISWELSSDLMYCGRLDTLVEWDGVTYILEHKTSSNLTMFCAQPNHQITGYVYGARVLGYNVPGAIVNLLGVYSPNTKKQPGELFARVITMRGEWELEDWRHHVLSVAERIRQALDANYFERATVGCNFCPYKKLCTSSPDVVEAVATQYYHERPWEPWKHETEGA